VRVTVAAILVLAIAAGFGGSAARAHPSAETALAPVEAINELLATAWGPLATQRAEDQERSLVQALEDWKLAGKADSKNGYKWSFSLKVKNAKASIDLSSPPAFAHASRDRFRFEQPRGAGFDLAVSGDVKGNAKVTLAGQKVFTWSPGLHFGLRVEDFKIVSEATLDNKRPNRPSIADLRIHPSLSLRGGGFLPVDLPISFTTETKGETIVLRGKLTAVKLKEELSGLGASLTGDLVVSLLPKGQAVLDVGTTEPQLGVDVDDVPIRGDYRSVKIELNGKLELSLKRVGSLSVPFRLPDLALPFPSPQSLDDLLTQVDGEPNRWGDDRRARYGPVPNPGTLAGPVAEIEAGAAKHAPHGAVLSFDFQGVRGRRGETAYAYSNDEDSAIFTGHYLAAESFRYAASRTPEALGRVKAALEGVRRLFWVTGDAVVTVNDGKTERTPVTLGPGILARTAKPTSDPVPYTRAGGAEKSGPLERRPCHYMRPEGGWRAGGRVYPRLADVPAAVARGVTAEPVGTVWYGWGCGTNHPVSRDQYAGVMMGLGLAYELVPDAEVRATARTLIGDALKFLYVDNRWNVRIPPDGRIVETSTFLGDFPKQLAFLRIGKTAGVPAAANAYDELQRGVELAWLPVWLGSFFPLTQYYKFNLSHAAFVPALVLEGQPSARERWYSSYLLLWEPVAHHKNAYFDLARVLAEPEAKRQSLLRAPASATNPGVPLGDEVRIVLAEWIRRWTLVKGKWGPLNKVADPSHQLALWPNDIERYSTLDGTSYCLARYALPVDGRRAKNAEYLWEHSPFRVSLSVERCTRSPRPDSNQIRAQDEEREGAGVDYLLPYWLGVYLGVLPKPS
jgi:hypothetical protein